MNPPVFGHGELRLVLLTLISERPRHGYELIQALTDHFGGSYSPSAGTIYPRLAKLEQEGLVTKRADGRKSVYAITAAGRREVHDRREEFDRITLDSTETISALGSSARSGLASARTGLRAEIDRIAAEARRAAEATAAATAAQFAAGAPGAGQTAAGAHSGTGADAAAAGSRSGASPAGAASAAHDVAAGAGRSAATGAAASAPTDGATGPATSTPTSPASSTATADATSTATDGAPASASAEAPPAAAGAESAAPSASRGYGRMIGGPLSKHREPAADDAAGDLLPRLDAAMQRFRMNLRHDAREGARQGLLDADAVEAFEADLVRLGRDFAARMRIHR